MQVDLKDFFEIIVAIATVGTLIYRLGETKAEVYRKIDQLDKKIDIYVAEERGKEEFREYLVHGLDDKIDHKFQRIMNVVRELQEFLEKNLNYSIRKND